MSRCTCKSRSSSRSSALKGFSQAGGLSEHIDKLRNVIVFPLINPELYRVFKLRPVRGVLFYGPPGTGKTLLGKALAEECNTTRKCKKIVSFFQCNGGEIFDKYVGSSEQNLRNIFQSAISNKPSIIFFDEIDALAPKRDQRQDHVHTSVVATLLKMIDELDEHSGVVIIGATNRIDFVDPALRRPGRFDMELYFGLPNRNSRKEIIKVLVNSWPNKPSKDLVSKLAHLTDGFSGSDLHALCAEAVLCHLKRVDPEAETMKSKLSVNLLNVKVDKSDFMEALRLIMPANCRNYMPYVDNQLMRSSGPWFCSTRRSLSRAGRRFKRGWTDFWGQVGQSCLESNFALIDNELGLYSMYTVPEEFRRMNCTNRSCPMR